MGLFMYFEVGDPSTQLHSVLLFCRSAASPYAMTRSGRSRGIGPTAATRQLLC